MASASTRLAGLPVDVKSTLEAAIKEAVESDSYQEFQEGAGNPSSTRTRLDFTKFVNEQFGLFKELLG